MKMVRHDYKLMQQIFPLPPVVQQDIYKQIRHSVRLQQLALLTCGSSDVVTAISGIAAQRSSHRSPQRLKPIFKRKLYRSAASAAPPKITELSIQSRHGTGQSGRAEALAKAGAFLFSTLRNLVLFPEFLPLYPILLML